MNLSSTIAYAANFLLSSVAIVGTTFSSPS
jgi:hypothetical protein